MRRIAVVGASGRTGSLVTSLLSSEPTSRLCAALVSERSAVLGQTVPGTGVTFSSDVRVLEGCDGVIDFSTAENSVGVAKVCAEFGVPLLVASTGHSDEQQQVLRESSRSFPLCVASNTSLGATALGLAARYLREILGESFDVEVMEIHHRMKKDAPSGTAKSLTREVATAENTVVFAREGARQRGEVGVVSLRGGDVAGDHTVFFLGDGERLEITHRAQNREIFARGALVLLEKLSSLPAGFYSVQELLLKRS
jgi:4-hydroxy-tetrahydrodipicolinate reductase